MPKIISIILAVLIVLVGGFYWLNNYIYQEKQGEPAENNQRIAEPLVSATFECPDGKSIYAGFNEGSVALALSDSREVTLEQTVSASGARYANEGEVIIFWNKNSSAFVEENGVTTYKDCEVAPPSQI